MNAQLFSKNFPATNGQCLSYWYWYLNGPGGSFNITLMSTQNYTIQTMLLSTSGGWKWERAEVGLHSKTDFKVLFSVEAHPNSRYYFAIDDIDIKEGNCVKTCSSLPVTARIRCGPAQVKPLDCQRTFGCCYSVDDPAFPSCFYHPSSCESIPSPARTMCGSKYTDRYGCKRLGCCYDSTYVSFLLAI